MRRGTQERTPYKNEHDVLELFARVLVRGGYRVPVESAGTRHGLQSVDIAGAMGYMRDAVQRDVTLAVVTRAERVQLARVASMAYRRLCGAAAEMRPRAVNLGHAADRWRIRMVIYDALLELAHPESRRAYRALAKDTKMRAAEYTRLHKLMTAELQGMMSEARLEFKARLWGKAYV